MEKYGRVYLKGNIDHNTGLLYLELKYISSLSKNVYELKNKKYIISFFNKAAFSPVTKTRRKAIYAGFLRRG